MASNISSAQPAGGMQGLTNIAIGYSKSMDSIAAETANPNIAKSPALVAQFNTDLFYATQGYEMASRAIQTLHSEDKTLSDLLQNS